MTLGQPPYFLRSLFLFAEADFFLKKKGLKQNIFTKLPKAAKSHQWQLKEL